MIHIEVLDTPDPIALGLYKFEFNYVYIGRSKKNDLIIVDKDIPAYFLKLSIYSDGIKENLIVKNNLHDPFFHVNGKKISGSLKVKIDDVLSFGSTKIKISQFKKSINDVDLSDAFAAFESSASDLRPALDFIEEMIVDLEKLEQNV